MAALSRQNTYSKNQNTNDNKFKGKKVKIHMEINESGRILKW